MAALMINRTVLGGALAAFVLLSTAACSERTTPAAAPEATSDPAVETSASQAQQKTPQGEVPADDRPRN